MVAIGFKVPGFAPKTQAVLDVLEKTVFAKRGKLYRKLVIEDQKAAWLRVSNYPKVDEHLFEIWAAGRKVEDLPVIETAVIEALQHVARHGVDSKALRETAAHMRYAFAAELGSAKGVASNAAWFVSLSGKISSINALWDEVARVTPQSLQEAAARFFTAARRTVVTMVPETQP